MVVPVVPPEEIDPDDKPMVAIAVFELVHVPPLNTAVKVVAETVQIVVAPEITGKALTVITLDAAVPQPFE